MVHLDPNGPYVNTSQTKMIMRIEDPIGVECLSTITIFAYFREKYLRLKKTIYKHCQTKIGIVCLSIILEFCLFYAVDCSLLKIPPDDFRPSVVRSVDPILISNTVFYMSNTQLYVKEIPPNEHFACSHILLANFVVEAKRKYIQEH